MPYPAMKRFTVLMESGTLHNRSQQIEDYTANSHSIMVCPNFLS